MIVEIGTSDFRTQAGKEDGLFVEPVPYYFDRLPECRKENVAVSNYTGFTKVYYLSGEDISLFGLPPWVRGCSSVGSPHHTVMKILQGMSLGTHIIREAEVPVVRIMDLLNKHGIDSIDFLKIDTEGHDCIILNDFLDTTHFLPKRIQFESNELSDPEDVEKVTDRLIECGYKCMQTKADMICVLS